MTGCSKMLSNFNLIPWLWAHLKKKNTQTTFQHIILYNSLTRLGSHNLGMPNAASDRHSSSTWIPSQRLITAGKKVYLEDERDNVERRCAGCLHHAAVGDDGSLPNLVGWSKHFPWHKVIGCGAAQHSAAPDHLFINLLITKPSIQDTLSFTQLLTLYFF